jgi:hydrogenase maturation protease
MNEWEWSLLEARAPIVAQDSAGAEVAAGDRVRLTPKRSGEALDLFLTGKTATIETIEQDYEGQIHLAVVVDDDPGRDLGLARQPGHRFFFVPQEVELVERRHTSGSVEPAAPSVLVAGIGNIFLGDDGFGVETIRRLDRARFPEHVKIVDFGIRGFDLACALVAGHDVAILIDACSRGGSPGTLRVIEPDLTSLDADTQQQPEGGPHGLDPLNVIRLARVLGGAPCRLLVVGCEPGTFGGDEGLMGLSPAVEAAVDGAVTLVESLVARLSRHESIEPDKSDSARSKEGE